MRNVATSVVLGLCIVVGSFAMSSPAHATEQRWNNRATGSQGQQFFFGVSGCCTCFPRVGCKINPGTGIIIWQLSQDDQIWDTTAPANGVMVQNRLDDGSSRDCLGVSSVNPPGITNNGAQMIIQACNASNNAQKWNIKRAEDWQAPFPGCFTFQNVNSLKFLGVSGGTMQNGTKVIQWTLFQGTPNMTTGWHADQFWCPVAP
jgi:hypothetical protein